MNRPAAPPPGPGGADYALGPLLRRAAQRAATAFAARLAPLGIDGRHFGLMIGLARQGPLSQRQLGALTGNDKSAVVRTLDDLEARGLVRREPVPGDRRARAVTLTDEGVDLFARAEQVARTVNDELLAHLSDDERDQLRRLLARFIDPGSP